MFSLTGFDDSLLNQLQYLQQEVDQLFGASGWRGDIRSGPRANFPAINVASTPDQMLVYLFAPGIDARSLDISVQDGVLAISGRRDGQPTAPDGAAPQKPGAPAGAGEARGRQSAGRGGSESTWYRRERFAGDFRRIVTLPDDVDSERVQARYRDGIVQITLPRRESAKPRRIEVN